jgi:hypothetical protein
MWFATSGCAATPAAAFSAATMAAMMLCGIGCAIIKKRYYKKYKE